jgi:hypothetical protein
MVSSYLEKILLDCAFRGDTSNTPSAWAVGLSDIAGDEIVDLNYQRQAASFDPATNGTATVGTIMTFGPFVNAQTPATMQVWDDLTAGHLLYAGPLDVLTAMDPGEGVLLPVGNVAVSLT